MNCISCGAALGPGTKICPRCGLSAPPSNSKSSSSRFRLILLTVLGVVLFDCLWAGGAYLRFRTRLSANPFFQESVKIAQSSPELRGLIGQPIQEGLLATGEVQQVYGSDFAQWTARLKGPKGTGQLEGVANRLGPSWHYSRLLFRLEGGKSTVDLTPLPRPDNLVLAEHTKKVYLVPLGAVQDRFLTWAPAYYKAKFGVEVEVLPPIPLNESVMNSRRHQLIAENLISLMREALPDRDKDQYNILIGVTSGDMYIHSFDWNYAINYRQEGRFGVVSTARLQPVRFFQQWNNALAVSRLQKMITKNIYLLGFDLPMSSDYTSAVSGGVMSPEEIDCMSDELIGAERRWHSSLGALPTVSMVLAPEQPPAWNMEWSAKPPTEVSADYFAADLWVGIFVHRRTDFYLSGDSPLQFVRTYTSRDEPSRDFGVGTNHSLDIAISGDPGKYLALTLENGVRTYFDRDVKSDTGGRQAYRGRADYFSRFSHGLILLRGYDVELETTDGWHYFFPNRPTAKTEEKTAVLTGFTDPQGRRYEMQRNAGGELLRVTTPVGKWLNFERDAQGLVRRIEDSGGRSVSYEYDSRGALARVSDSQGNVEAYRYDDKNQMIAVLDGRENVRMTITYSPQGWVTGQTLADGRVFRYEYQRNQNGKVSQIRFTDPRGYVTQFDSAGQQFLQSLPVRPPALN